MYMYDIKLIDIETDSLWPVVSVQLADAWTTFTP